MSHNDNVPEVPIICLLLYNNSNISAIDEYRNKWIILKSLSRIKSKKIKVLKSNLETAGISSQYFAAIKVKNNTVQVVNYEAISTHSFSNDALLKLDAIESVLNVIKTQQYTLQTVKNNLIFSNMRTITITKKFNNNELTNQTAMNSHIFKTVIYDEKQQEPQSTASLTKSCLISIFSGVTFHEDKQIDMLTKQAIVNDFVNNFKMKALKFPSAQMLRKKQINVLQNNNKNEHSPESETMIFIGSCKADCQDSNLRKFVFNNEPLSNVPMAYKLTNSPDQTMEEIYANFDIVGHGYRKFKVPQIYPCTITDYVTHSGDILCTMFGMDAVSCDMAQFIQGLVKVKLKEGDKMRLVVSKIWQAGLVANNIYDKTNVCHFDIAARNIFLTNVANKTEAVDIQEGYVKIRKTSVSLGDWQLSGVNNELHWELGKLPMFFGARIYCPDDIYGKTIYMMDKINSYMFSMVLLEVLGGSVVMNEVKEIVKSEDDMGGKMKKILDVFKVQGKNDEFVVDAYCHLAMLLVDSLKFNEKKRMNLNEWLLNDFFLFLNIPQAYAIEIQNEKNCKMKTTDLLIIQASNAYNMTQFIQRQQKMFDDALGRRGIWI